ncbi:MAG: MATE family efflux transporter, partial [Pseudomonadota bacterium]
LQSVTAGILRGYSDTSALFAYATLSFWLFGLPACWLLTFTLGFGAAGLWMGLTLALTLYAVLLFRRFRLRAAAFAGAVDR